MQTTSTIAFTTATRVNLGPLTTTFNPPSDCTSLRFINDDVVFMGAALGFGCHDVQYSTVPCALDSGPAFPAGQNLPPPPDSPGAIFACSSYISTLKEWEWFPCPTKSTTEPICTITNTISDHEFSLTQSCYPPNFASSFNLAGYNSQSWTSPPPIYSPGLACPSENSPQCTIERIKGIPNTAATTTVANANNVIWSMLNDGETALGCCPSNYVCDQNSPHICTSQPPSGDIIGVKNGISCSSGTASAQSSTALTAEAIRILLVKSATSNAIAKETSSPKKSSGKGEQIAIGVAVPIAILLISAAVFYFVKRRKRLRKQTSDQEVLAGGGDSDSGLKAELPGSFATAISGPKGAAFQKPELDNMQLSVTPMPELPGNLPGDVIQELHGNSSTPRLNDATIPASEPQNSISHDIAGEHQQKPVDDALDQDPSSKAVPGLWDWSNFDTLGETNQSPRNSTTDIRR